MEAFAAYVGLPGERLSFPTEATAYLQALARDVAAIPAFWKKFEAWGGSAWSRRIGRHPPQ